MIAAPGVVGVGADIVDVARVRTALERRGGMSERLFTEGERAYAARFSDPWPRLAARFAAKEAVLKSLGVGLGAASLAEIEVVRAPSGAPSIHLCGAAASLAAERGVARIEVSLSHTDTLAQAFAIAIGEPGCR